MSTAMIWQTVSTSSADTERLGQALGQLLKSPEITTRPALERSARRKRGTDGTVYGDTETEYRSLQHSDVPRAAGATGFAGWQGGDAGCVIELHSDLGGGKTTFVRGLARGLGSKDTVASPTFIINRIYKCKEKGVLHHFDFYRLSEPGIAADQLAESLKNPNAVTVVEWSGIVQNVLPKDRIRIEFRPVETSSDQRQVDIHYPQSKADIIRQLETMWQEIKP